MNRSTVDLWVGIFVMLGIGAILFLALKVGNLVSVGSTPGYRLEANFDNVEDYLWSLLDSKGTVSG